LDTAGALERSGGEARDWGWEGEALAAERGGGCAVTASAEAASAVVTAFDGVADVNDAADVDAAGAGALDGVELALALALEARRSERGSSPDGTNEVLFISDEHNSALAPFACEKVYE